MRKVFISKNYRGAFTASSKAKIDAENIAQQNGYNSIGLSFKTFNNSCIGKIWTVLSNFMGHYRLPKDGVLLLQVPTSLTNPSMSMSIICSGKNHHFHKELIIKYYFFCSTERIR